LQLAEGDVLATFNDMDIASERATFEGVVAVIRAAVGRRRFGFRKPTQEETRLRPLALEEADAAANLAALKADVAADELKRQAAVRAAEAAKLKAAADAAAAAAAADADANDVGEEDDDEDDGRGGLAGSFSESATGASLGDEHGAGFADFLRRALGK